MADNALRFELSGEDIEAQLGASENNSAAHVPHGSKDRAIIVHDVSHARSTSDISHSQPPEPPSLDNDETTNFIGWKRSREAFRRLLRRLADDGMLKEKAFQDLGAKYGSTEPIPDQPSLGDHLDGVADFAVFNGSKCLHNSQVSMNDKLELAKVWREGDIEYHLGKEVEGLDGSCNITWRWLHLDRNIQSWFEIAAKTCCQDALFKGIQSEWYYQLNMTKTSTTGLSWMNPHVQHTEADANSFFLLCFPFLGHQNDIEALYANWVLRDERDRHGRRGIMSPDDLEKIWQHGASIDEVFLRCYQQGTRHVHSLSPDLQPRRTLDQYFHSHLSDSTERDLDQVVGRYAKQHLLDIGHETAILTVDQCWVLVVGDHTIITSFPSKSTRNRVVQSLEVKVKKGKIKGAADAAQVIIDTCASNEIKVPSFTRPRDRLFDFFDNSLNHIADDQARVFKSLWAEASAAESTISDQLFDTNREFKMLAEVMDIKEELEMIIKVMEEQSETFLKLPRGLQDLRLEAIKRKALVINKIGRAQNLEAGLNRLLQLKGQRAAVAEARASRQLALSSEKQNSSVMLFTIITIIFLPLSTMASIFGMNAAEFGQGPVPMWKICACIFPISIFFVALFVSIGLNDDLRRCLVMCFKILSQWLRLKMDIPQEWLESQAGKLQETYDRLAQKRDEKSRLRRKRGNEESQLRRRKAEGEKDQQNISS